MPLNELGQEYFDRPSLLELVDLKGVPSVEERVKRLVAEALTRERTHGQPSMVPGTGVEIHEGLDDPDGEQLTHAEAEYKLSEMEIEMRHEEKLLRAAAERRAAAVPDPVSPDPALPKAV